MKYVCSQGQARRFSMSRKLVYRVGPGNVKNIVAGATSGEASAASAHRLRVGLVAVVRIDIAPLVGAPCGWIGLIAVWPHIDVMRRAAAQTVRERVGERLLIQLHV